MDKVGRNDPCPCGSGKKYKKCCEKEQKVIELFSGEITNDEANEVRRLLELFISDKNLHLSEQIDEIFHLAEIPEKNLKSAEGLAFEWFVMDGPFEEEESFFDYFLREIRGKIDLRLLKKLESWKTSYLSVYDVESHLENEKILLKDIFTKEEKVLSVFGLENIPKVNDLLVTRLVPVEGKYEYFFGALGIDMFSRKTLIDLLALDKEAENKTWEGFLKEDGEQLVDNVIEMYFRGDQENEPFDEEEAQDYIAFNFAIRRFLTEPQPVLQGKTPLEAVYDPEMKEALEEFLEGIEFGDYDDEERHMVEFSSFSDEVVDLLTTDVKDLNDLLNLQWEKAMYKTEAELFVRKTFGRYFPEDIAKALTVWYEYCEIEKPDLRKTGSWASALEHLISNVFAYKDPRSQKEIAEIYQVSAGTILRNMKKLEVYFFNELQEDATEEFPDWMQDLDEETLLEMERATGELADKLESQDFQSLDKAGEIPDWLKEMLESKEIQEMMGIEVSEEAEDTEDPEGN